MTDTKGRKISADLARRVDPARRDLLRLILGAAGAYAAPEIASFPMQGVGTALAQGDYYMTPM